MTREEHIEAAERLLGRTPGCACARCLAAAEPSAQDVARAHVHALLALAKAEVTR
jgi:hypothetical protein